MRHFLTALLLLACSAIGGHVCAQAPGGSPATEPPAQALEVERTGVVDLWQLFQEAAQEDPRILAARARSQSAAWRQREAYGQLLPQVAASGSYNRTLQEYEVARRFYNGERYALGVSQVLYDPEIWHNYRRFNELAQQQAAEYEATLEESTVDLVERYFMALAAEDELELVAAELRATQRNQERINALYARQLAMVTDVLEVSARVDGLAARVIEARNRVEISREALSELVGRPVVERLKRIGPAPQFHMPPQDKTYWVTLAAESNPVLRARQKAVDAAQASLRQAKAGHLPTVTLSLNGQRSDIGYENSIAPRTDTYVANLGVQVPIYSGGSTSARVSSMYEDLMTAEHELEAARRQVSRETRSAFNDMEAGLSKISALRKALVSAEKSRTAAERAFGLGVMNAVDVLDTVKEEYAARRDLLKSQYDFIMSVTVLRRWSGTLAADDVRQANAWLIEPPVR